VHSCASSVITVSSESGKTIASDFNIPGNKVHTIYNGLSFPLLDELKSEKVTEFSFRPDVKYILAVGSINRAKNYGLLLESFSIVYSRHKNVQLIILGKGDLEDEVRSHADSIDLKDVVHLQGYNSNPYKFMSAASCYALSSRWEGFPNSLLEAMYVNGHVVSTDCPTGPSEIISNNVDGILCSADNAEELAEALEKMCFDDDFRRKVFENSRKGILKFDETIMINRYKELILQ
jgi:glycosyltransferase involved in cell wall biosynthesis